MPTGLSYSLPADVLAQAAYESARRAAQYEAEQRAAAMAERQRQFDVGLDYRAQEVNSRNNLAYQELDQRAYAIDANFAADQQRNALYAQNMATQADLQYAQQASMDDYRNRSLDAQQQAQAQAVEREKMRMMAGLAAQQQEQQFNRALASQKAINDYKGFTSQAQFDQAVQQWEQDTGMDWDFPQRSIAERAGQDFEQRKQQYIGGLSKLTGLPPEDLSELVMEGEGGIPQLAVDPRLVIGMGESRMSDQRLRELKAADDQFKRDKMIEDQREAERDRAIELQKQQQAQAETQRKFHEKVLLESFEPVMESKKDAEGNEVGTERPRTPAERQAFVNERMGEYMKAMGGGTGGAQSAPKQISTQAEYAALPSGTKYIAPDGTTRTKP